MSVSSGSRMGIEHALRRHRAGGFPGAEHAAAAPATADSRSIRLSGVLMLCAGAAILMAIITAEALFRAPYNTSHNEISDLGSTWNPGGIVREPSATIFNVTMLITGAALALAAVMLYRGSRRRALAIAVGILGLGILAVGIFPGEITDGKVTSAGVHPLAALAAFLSGAVAALLSARVARGPFRYAAATLGLLALGSLLLSGPLGDTRLGAGGTERWIAYPTVLWLVAFGGYLLAVRPDELRRPTKPSAGRT